MNDSGDLNNYPQKYVQPYDGMAVTADVWSLAHEEHRQTSRAHNLCLHGSGIVTGLEVVANDPADQYVFISPGIAIDTAGNIIELVEPVAYDFGKTAEGSLYLLLGHGKRELGGAQKEIRFTQNEFVIAARSSIPKRPSVELARVTLSQPAQAITNASDPRHPGRDELDLRFRKPAGPNQGRPISLALCYLGEENSGIVRGWDFLASEYERTGPNRLIINPWVPISSDLSGYDLLYLAITGEVTIEAETVTHLESYLAQGKNLILEALDPSAEDSCHALLTQLNRTLAPPEDDGNLFTRPFLFTSPPAGINGNQCRLDDQVIYSTAGYSLAWTGVNGETRLTRSEIRSLHEWGLNMLMYSLP